MPLPRRRVDRASRQLVFWLFDDFVRALGPVDTAMDLACGVLAMAPLVQANRYIAVDLDKARLEAGVKKRAPHAEAHLCKIEDLSPSLTADFVFCLQCIGMNKFFDARATMTCVDRMIAATHTGGALVFNLGPLSLEWHDQAERAVKSSFDQVRIVRYGRFRKALPHRHLALSLAALMRQFPKLADGGPASYRLYMCEDRLAP